MTSTQERHYLLLRIPPAIHFHIPLTHIIHHQMVTCWCVFVKLHCGHRCEFLTWSHTRFLSWGEGAAEDVMKAAFIGTIYLAHWQRASRNFGEFKINIGHCSECEMKWCQTWETFTHHLMANFNILAPLVCYVMSFENFGI